MELNTTVLWVLHSIIFFNLFLKFLIFLFPFQLSTEIILINYKPHDNFTISELNVIHKIDIDYKEFLFGFQRKIKFLDGKNIVISSDKILYNEINKEPVKIIKRKGLNYRNIFGDFIIKFNIKSPCNNDLNKIKKALNIQNQKNIESSVNVINLNQI